MIIALVLIIVAGVLHVLAAIGVTSRIGLSELGWAFFTFALAAFWYGGVR